MFILSYPTTESPFRIKNVPSDVTFLLQIDLIFGHLIINIFGGPLQESIFLSIVSPITYPKYFMATLF
jgi:hypothetical protein